MTVLSKQEAMVSGLLRGYHDVGGRPAGPVEKTTHPFQPWQKTGEAMRVALELKSRLVSLDELRRGFESFGAELYSSLGFYERRAEALTVLLDEKGVLRRDEIVARMREIAAGRGQSVDVATRTVR